MRETRVELVNHCARCGKDHEIKFYKIEPIPDLKDKQVKWGWLGFCDNEDAPVVLTDRPLPVRQEDES